MHLADTKWVPHSLNAPPTILDRYTGQVDWGGRKKVLIYGAGHGRALARPLMDDASWVVWALNVVPPFLVRPGGVRHLRCDAWFELHEMKAQSLNDLRWMTQCPVPLYVVPQAMDDRGFVHTPMQTVDGQNPGGHLKLAYDGERQDWILPVVSPIRFPLAEMEQRFGGYWACTFAYQMALAVASGFTDIGLFGVDLAHGTLRERTVEWANVSWWAGYLEAKGVTLHMPDGASIGCHPARYGIEYDEEIAAVTEYTDRWRQFERFQDERETVGAGGPAIIKIGEPAS